MKNLLRIFAFAAVLSCGRGYAPDGSLENGEHCRGGNECASGRCVRRGGDDFSTCESPCKGSGASCGPKAAFDSACCSGYCSQEGTCSI